MDKFKKIVLVFLMVFSLVSCKKDEYTIEEYLIDLANDSGINETEDIDEAFSSLLKWEIVKEEDYSKLKDSLTYGYLLDTLIILSEDEDLLSNLEEEGLISDIKETGTCKKEDAKTIMNYVIDQMNHPELEDYYSFEYKEEIKEVKSRDEINYEEEGIVFIEEEEAYYRIEDGQLKECDFEEIFDDFEMSGTFEVDFNDAKVEMNGVEEEALYRNENYELLSKTSKVFNVEGFRISYSLSSSGIHFRVSKSITDGITAYGDLSLSNIKPTIDFNFEDKKLVDASLLVDYKSTGRLGFSNSRYKKLYADFRNLDASSFKNLLKSALKEGSDALEATIPICTISTPIPNVPTATFDMQVVLKLYAGGKAELALYDSNSLGFELKDGNIRFVHELDHDHDLILRASAKTALGLNLGVTLTKYRLMDIELDGGIKAEIKSTMHLYDKDGEVTSEESSLSYDALETLSEDNEDVEVCGDLSLRWLLDLQFNTYRTLLYKYGFTSTKEFLDDDDQVFGNLHHIENGQFVEKCTRGKKKSASTKSIHVSADNILLSDYSIVLQKGETYTIEPVLPDGYTLSDLKYSFSKEGIVSNNGNVLTGISSGAVKVEIATSDELYKVYLNVLVSYE